MFPIAVRDIKVITFSRKLPDILSALNHLWNLLTYFRKIPPPPHPKFRKNPSSGNGANLATTVGRTDIRAERHVRPFLRASLQVIFNFSRRMAHALKLTTVLLSHSRKPPPFIISNPIHSPTYCLDILKLYLKLTQETRTLFFFSLLTSYYQ
jgi:hypothetical protein